MKLWRLPLFLWLLLAAAAAHAQQFPKFTGLVVDQANIIPPAEEAAMTQRLEQLDRTTGRQLAVVTIPDLQGYPIEDYGYRLGRNWGVGEAKSDNGAILIVAPNERKVRVEVGYGLEPVLTDAVSSLIINRTILPRFRSGDMAGGIAAGATAVADQLSLPDDQAKAKVAEATAEIDRSRRGNDGGFPIGAIFFVIIFFLIIGSMARGRRRFGRYRGQRFGGSAWPIVLWTVADELSRGRRGGWGSGGGWDGGSGGGWSGGGGFGGGGGGSFGGGGASGSW